MGNYQTTESSGPHVCQEENEIEHLYGATTPTMPKQTNPLPTRSQFFFLRLLLPPPHLFFLFMLFFSLSSLSHSKNGRRLRQPGGRLTASRDSDGLCRDDAACRAARAHLGGDGRGRRVWTAVGAEGLAAAAAARISPVSPSHSRTLSSPLKRSEADNPPSSLPWPPFF
ncbi:hypothetical protein VTG60DRAFT_6513 [Thermothelomyces hinnuleus]